MEKLNVCLMNDSFPPAIDGVANAVTNYGKIIAGGLGRAAVVTPYYPDADDSVFDFPVFRYPSLDVTKLVGYRAGLPFDAETMGRMEKQGFDIIHSHCPISSTVLARALRDRIDAPVVMTYHTKFDVDIANAVRGQFLRDEAARFLAGNIAACDEVWTVSRGAGENLRKLGYEGDYTVMPNGVDLPRGRVSDALVEKATAGYDLPAGVPVFLFVGRMMWYKGIRIILDALAYVKDAGVDFRMVFVGGGGDRDEIAACVRQLGLEDKVLFVPPIHDRDLLGRVGENAQRQLYLSWEDAVKNAWARYPAVIDNYRRGLYPKHDGLSDGLLHGLAAALDGLNKGRERYRHMQEDVADGLEDLKDGLGDLKEGLSNGLEDLKEGLEDLTDGLDDLKEDLADGARRLKDRLEELGKKLDI